MKVDIYAVTSVGLSRRGLTALHSRKSRPCMKRLAQVDCDNSRTSPRDLPPSYGKGANTSEEADEFWCSGR